MQKGDRLCKECSKQFTKRYSLQAYCCFDCEAKAKQGRVKAPSVINKVSKTNYYKTSTGRISASILEINIRKAKAEKLRLMEEEEGYIYCEDCEKFGKPEGINQVDLDRLDCSHNVSVGDAKKMGKSELAYDIKNIMIRCRYHHQKHDKLN